MFTPSYSFKASGFLWGNWRGEGRVSAFHFLGVMYTQDLISCSQLGIHTQALALPNLAAAASVRRFYSGLQFSLCFGSLESFLTF